MSYFNAGDTFVNAITLLIDLLAFVLCVIVMRRVRGNDERSFVILMSVAIATFLGAITEFLQLIEIPEKYVEMRRSFAQTTSMADAFVVLMLIKHMFHAFKKPDK